MTGQEGVRGSGEGIASLRAAQLKVSSCWVLELDALDFRAPLTGNLAALSKRALRADCPPWSLVSHDGRLPLCDRMCTQVACRHVCIPSTA